MRPPWSAAAEFANPGPLDIGARMRHTAPMKEFRFDDMKAMQAVRWLLSHEKGGRAPVDHLCRGLFFADREVVNLLGRPIFGDRYMAMKHGPVPVSIHAMMEGLDRRRLLEEWNARSLDADRMDEFPWTREGDCIALNGAVAVDQDPDRACPRVAPKELEIVGRSLGDMDRWRWDSWKTVVRMWTDGSGNRDESWSRARRRPGNLIAYEDMLDADGEWDV